MSARTVPPTGRIALVQVTAMLALSGLAYVTLGLVFAGSVLLGGLISIIPNAYFAHKVFRHTGARAMETVVRNAYLGEFVKLALTGAGFGLAFVLVEPLHVPGLFAGFVLVHVTGIAALVTSQYGY